MKGKQNFIFKPDDSEYVVALKKHNWWWLLLLLLLLPLLLLIPFKKDVLVKTVDSQGTIIPMTNVEFKYTDYQMFNFKTKRFFTHDSIVLNDVSDTTKAIAEFTDVRYTLYSRLLFSGKKAEISGANDCFGGDSLYRFHRLKNGKVFNLVMGTRTYDYIFTVIDKENGQPIPGATVVGDADVNGQTKHWSQISEPDGTVYFENFPYCGQFSIIADADGYVADTIMGSSQTLYNNDTLRTIPLEPEKAMIQFFVYDLHTKKPLPNATAHLIIDGDTVQTVVTNVNGVGQLPGEGEFQQVSVNKNFTIHAQKAFYYDTTRSDNVAHWVTLPDTARILYLRPATQTLEFRDVDAITRQGVGGVKNIIYVNGAPQPQPVYSNANGYFSVSGVKPTDVISIVASKSGYETNNYTIKDKKMQDLIDGTDEDREIPLTKKTPPPPPPPPPTPPNPSPNPTPPPPPPPGVLPCESPQESGGQGVTVREHSIGTSHDFIIHWNMYNVPDQLIVYCGTGPSKKQIFSTRGAVSGRGTANLHCSGNYITIKIIGQQDGTQWEYDMDCN